MEDDIVGEKLFERRKWRKMYHIVLTMTCENVNVNIWRDSAMNKDITMSIRVSQDEMNKLKQAARIEAYASYSEFVRRTALKEAQKIIANEPKESEIS